jgi:hypothetical protein
MPRKKPKKAQEINEKIAIWDNYWKDNKNTYNEYMQFIFGNQWLDEEARVFETYKKIPLTFNKLAPLANHLLGEQRQNTPSIECLPDDNTPEETVEVREALVKDITFDSKSKEVFQTAFQSSLCGGFGCFYVDTEYENDYSFNQVIRIREEKIPTRAVWDVSATTPCKTDGMYCGLKSRMSRDKFASIYGREIERDIPPSNIEEGSVFNDDESVTLVTWWERKYKREKLRQLSDGSEVTEEEFKALERIMIDDDEILVKDGIPVTITNERNIAKYKVRKSLYAGDWELEAEDFPSRQLPLVYVDQSSFWNKQGQQVCRPFFKDTKDAQRYINYLGTQSAYLVKIGRYDQFLVSKENVRGNDTQAIWRDPSNIQGGLIFDESPSNFVPMQLKPPELSVSLVQQYERAERDIQTCTGMYDAFIGEKSNEVSKIAIDARNKRSSYNTHLPFDNLNRAVAVCAQLVDEMIPTVYDTERTVMLNMKQKGVQAVRINESMDEYGTKIKNDMTKGRYTIRLVPGPSWEGQKEEALNSMQLILQANPQLFNLMADLFVENLPLNNNIELRNRLRTIVPPQVIEAGKTGEPLPPEPPPPDPMVIAKMKELQLKEQDLKQKQQKLELDSHISTQEMELKWQQLEDDRKAAAAELMEVEMKYLAETGRTQSDEAIAHANNMVRLLTHASTQHANAVKQKHRE